MSEQVYFVVGEEVICNGLDRVISAGPFTTPGIWQCSVCGTQYLIAEHPTAKPGDIVYQLEGDHSVHSGCCAFVRQKLLRKKPKPGSMSFSELMKIGTKIDGGKKIGCYYSGIKVVCHD